MFERFLCDEIYVEGKRLEIHELICEDRAEAVEWSEEYFLEMHLTKGIQPDILCLRKDDEVIAELGTHFDALTWWLPSRCQSEFCAHS